MNFGQDFVKRSCTWVQLYSDFLGDFYVFGTLVSMQIVGNHFSPKYFKDPFTLGLKDDKKNVR